MSITAERRRATRRIIEKRLRQIQQVGIVDGNKDVEQPHRLAKRVAFGCRVSNCKICAKERKMEWYEEELPEWSIIEDMPLEDR